LIFVYPIYNHNWININYILYITGQASKENILKIKKLHREAGQAKDILVPL